MLSLKTKKYGDGSVMKYKLIILLTVILMCIEGCQHKNFNESNLNIKINESALDLGTLQNYCYSKQDFPHIFIGTIEEFTDKFPSNYIRETEKHYYAVYILSDNSYAVVFFSKNGLCELVMLSDEIIDKKELFSLVKIGKTSMREIKEISPNSLYIDSTSYDDGSSYHFTSDGKLTVITYDLDSATNELIVKDCEEKQGFNFNEILDSKDAEFIFQH